MFDTLLLGGIPILLLVIGIVESAKKLGLSGTGCQVLALVLGVLFTTLIELVNRYPNISPWVTAIVLGLALGMTASGLYDYSKRFMAGK